MKKHRSLNVLSGPLLFLLVLLMCNTEDDISLRMQAFGRRAAGTLRFSVSHVRTDYFLRSYLIPFAKENPDISYQFHDATVEQQQQQLEAGSIDFAFANAPLPAAHNFATIKVQRENFYAFYNAGFAVPWAGKSMLSPEDLAGVPLCCNYGSYALLRSVFKDYAVKPNVAFIATTAESALTFATSEAPESCARPKELYVTFPSMEK